MFRTTEDSATSESIFSLPNPVISESKRVELTAMIETLEHFEDFAPEVKRVVIALYASHLADECGWRAEIIELHLHAIANHAGLEVL